MNPLCWIWGLLIMFWNLNLFIVNFQKQKHLQIWSPCLYFQQPLLSLCQITLLVTHNLLQRCFQCLLFLLFSFHFRQWGLREKITKTEDKKQFLIFKSIRRKLVGFVTVQLYKVIIWWISYWLVFVKTKTL